VEEENSSSDRAHSIKLANPIREHLKRSLVTCTTPSDFGEIDKSALPLLRLLEEVTLEADAHLHPRHVLVLLQMLWKCIVLVRNTSSSLLMAKVLTLRSNWSSFCFPLPGTGVLRAESRRALRFASSTRYAAASAGCTRRGWEAGGERRWRR
jgi:hypothetical protein